MHVHKCAEDLVRRRLPQRVHDRGGIAHHRRYHSPASIDQAVSAPLLIIQGGADEVVPVATTQLLATHLCSIGQDVERWIYPGQSHSGVVAPSVTDMAHWISDRFADQPNPDTYPPFGAVGIEVSRCPS
jgi:dipeptidyl aminopeptidase/acylaminoacyl peptidase